MTEVVVTIGPGQIGQAIARRVGMGKHILLADMRAENAAAAAKVLSDSGYEVSTATVDVSSRKDIEALVQQATALGEVTRLIQAAGVSESGLPRDGPQGRSLRHRHVAGRVRQGDRPRRIGRGDRLPVGPPTAATVD